MLAPGHDEATQEKGMNPLDERLMQWMPNTIAPNVVIDFFSPETLFG